jgi:hypothetical protein
MRLLVTVVALAALLAGCGGQPDVIEPEPGESPSASTSQATAPELSDQVNEDSDEGAVAAASHWVDLLNYASISGDGAALRDYSRACEPCMDFAESAQDLSEKPDQDVWRIAAASVFRDEVAADVTFELELLGGERSEVTFELTPSPPFEITDLYRVEEGAS